MADFTPKEIDLSSINNGNRFEDGETASAEAINAPIEAAAYAQELAKNAVQKDSAVGRKVYGTDNDGTERTYKVDFPKYATVNSIPTRLTNGGLYVPTSSIGEENSGLEDGQEAVNRNFVEGKVAEVTQALENYVEKDNTAARKVYGTGADGTERTYSVGYSNSYNTNEIPLRSRNGAIIIPNGSIGEGKNSFDDGQEAVNRAFVEAKATKLYSHQMTLLDTAGAISVALFMTTLRSTSFTKASEIVNQFYTGGIVRCSIWTYPNSPSSPEYFLGFVLGIRALEGGNKMAIKVIKDSGTMGTIIINRSNVYSYTVTAL